jgi:AraC-like DNA-binding protein
LILKAGDRFAEIYEIFKKMCSNNDEKSLKENLSMLGQFYSLLGLMAPEGIEYNPPDDVETARNKLTRYIDFNYNVNISMKMLEKVGNMHRSSIFRLFKKSYGLSPSEYLAEYRMDRALHLLKNTDYSIKKIASLVGYENSAYFCKAFKKKYLKTPSEARKLT